VTGTRVDIALTAQVTAGAVTGASVPVSQRRRHAAALRLEPLAGRHGGTLAAYDPWLPWPPAPRTPSTFGMTPDEIRAEAERLLAAGWSRSEVRAVLAPPEPVAAA